MFCIFPKLFPNRMGRMTLLFACALICLALAPATTRGQRTKAVLDSDPDRPTFSDFKGVRIGMTTDEARKKLGSPRDKSAEQDLYVFNDTQVVQIFYDKAGAVSAVSIDYMEGSNGIPSAKDVLGIDAEAKSDGSQYKLMRYPKAGYWVSYSRTAGNSPTITITMQKIEH